MAATLRSLAGDRFHDFDVISAAQVSLTPEKTVLDRYVFLPHARTGIAAALVTPFDWGAPSRGTAEVKVPVSDDVRPPIDAEMTVRVYGPGDVTEIDARQVIRAFPKPDSGTAEPDDLAHVEFDRPDMPWLFTPCGPNAQGRLVPWITLVVSEQRHLQWGTRRGATRRARVRHDQLQPLGDAWAWAHAQVIGAKPADRDTAPTLDQRLGEANAAHNLSRLVCPRRLAAHTSYVALVVPTFLAGRNAGLGMTPPATLAPAWGSPNDFAAGDPSDMVELPVYFSWAFSTGDDGNFESLARKLQPAVAPPGVGRRRVDTSRPWPPVALAAGEGGAEMVVTGPVVSPQSPESAPAEAWASEAAQAWPTPVTDELTAKLNLADQQAHAPQTPGDPETPVVTPPLYGSLHARQPRIETGLTAAAAQPPWFRELNLDPRSRIVGGVATRVIQADQEALMAAAWNQVIGVETANRALRMAQLAARVNASLHRRHLARLSDTALLLVTERVHPKVLDAPQRTVWASLEESSLPTSVTLGAFRRLASVRGPVARASARNPAQPPNAVDRLVVQPDRQTTDWVRRYVTPDGVAALGVAARSLVTDELAEQVAGMGAAELLAAWRDEFAQAPAPDRLTRELLDSVGVRSEIDVTPSFAARAMHRLWRTAPAPDAVREDRQAAMVAVVHATLIQVLLDLAPDLPDYEEAPARLTEYCGQVLELSSVHDLEALRRSARASADRLRAAAGRLEPGAFLSGLGALAGRTVVGEASVDPPRGRVNAPGLSLLAKLDPAITVPARLHARLTSGSGRLPGWLRPSWFDDLRIEPVMANPRFAYPMYEPLHRYDREWMVPGLGKIQRPDMATLLVTNNHFIESYLVGLNHEMARELLWREYPTDQRGTYFSSFWTTQPELAADLHEAPWQGGALGAHMKGADAQIVFLVRGELVRRYPGVVAHAVRQAGEDAGIPLFETGGPVTTLFHVHLAPNVLLVGFQLTLPQVRAPGAAWWFTLSENPTEPRFGLDPSRTGVISRDNLIWDDFAVSRPGQFLDATRGTAIVFGDSTWGASSAQVASLLFQLPARAAFRATKMVDGATLHA